MYHKFCFLHACVLVVEFGLFCLFKCHILVAFAVRSHVTSALCNQDASIVKSATYPVFGVLTFPIECSLFAADSTWLVCVHGSRTHDCRCLFGDFYQQTQPVKL